MARSLLAALLLTTGIGGWVVYQNDYAIVERHVSIDNGDNPLHAVLALPEKGRGPVGLVVFVHGDGPIDATHDTFYRPIWESLAQAGFASLSWDKPGVNGAPGDWLAQSMAVRAAEAATAIAWARRQPDIDGTRIGMWGASQAGWVLPMIAAQDPRIRFMIAVSPAINWLRQGEYNTRAQLAADGTSPAEVAQALQQRTTTLTYLRAGASFADAAKAGAAAGFTPARWRFVGLNYLADASADLTRVHVPVLLLLGGRDVNVDVADTERGYRALLPDQQSLQVMHVATATHSMVPARIERDTALLTIVAIAAPRSLYAAGVLDAMRDFAARSAP
ncbi:alpha/beta hydrolase [Mycolicibacterium sp. CH28]|nr:alpha/beta hydrolase [Mycolicibacterium sp. CH28]